jgi:hypothetical protein
LDWNVLTDVFDCFTDAQSRRMLICGNYDVSKTNAMIDIDEIGMQLHTWANQVDLEVISFSHSLIHSISLSHTFWFSFSLSFSHSYLMAPLCEEFDVSPGNGESPLQLWSRRWTYQTSISSTLLIQLWYWDKLS